MPVRRPLTGSWRLLDEGGDKGVTKLGLLSTRLGDTVEVNLGVLCAGDGTGSALVRMGYHMSTRPGQGAPKAVHISAAEAAASSEEAAKAQAAVERGI